MGVRLSEAEIEYSGRPVKAVLYIEKAENIEDKLSKAIGWGNYVRSYVVKFFGFKTSQPSNSSLHTSRVAHIRPKFGERSSRKAAEGCCTIDEEVTSDRFFQFCRDWLFAY